jgi:hypothetical protein
MEKCRDDEYIAAASEWGIDNALPENEPCSAARPQFCGRKRCRCPSTRLDFIGSSRSCDMATTHDDNVNLDNPANVKNDFSAANNAKVTQADHPELAKPVGT